MESGTQSGGVAIRAVAAGVSMPPTQLSSVPAPDEATIAAFCARMLRSARVGKPGSALHGIAQLVREVISRHDSLARVFSSRDLDLTCLEIGRELRREEWLPDSVERSDRIVFVVTHLAPTGGHSRVLDDLMAAEQAAEYTVLISGLYNRFDAAAVAALYRARNASLEVATAEDPAARVHWLQRRLAELRPRRTYMLLHHFDAVSVAAVQPDLAGDLVYFHNCDHSLALGVHIPHALHVDFNAKGFYNCREREGVSGNVIWPLTAADQGHRVERPFLARGHLTTCCSGGLEKFDFGRGGVGYAYRYEDLVPYILRASGGTHIHVGRLSEAMIARIRQGLADLGIAESRFIHIEQVPSLWQSFLDLQVDAYIGSFPMGGGRAAVEAMGAGLPLVIHANYRSIFFDGSNEAYPGALIWRRPADLFQALKALTPSTLREHSALARAFYLRNHRGDLLRGAIQATALGQTRQPERPSHVGDALQAYVDENRPAFARWLARKGRRAPKPPLARLLRALKSALGFGRRPKGPRLAASWLAEIESLESTASTSSDGAGQTGDIPGG